MTATPVFPLNAKFAAVLPKVAEPDNGSLFAFETTTVTFKFPLGETQQADVELNCSGLGVGVDVGASVLVGVLVSVGLGVAVEVGVLVGLVVGVAVALATAGEVGGGLEVGSVVGVCVTGGSFTEGAVGSAAGDGVGDGVSVDGGAIEGEGALVEVVATTPAPMEVDVGPGDSVLAGSTGSDAPLSSSRTRMVASPTRRDTTRAPTAPAANSATRRIGLPAPPPLAAPVPPAAGGTPGDSSKAMRIRSRRPSGGAASASPPNIASGIGSRFFFSAHRGQRFR